MFDRLKEFYQHKHEFAALETLSDPSEYEGLAKLHRRDLQYQVLTFPSFDPFRSWSLYRNPKGWLVRRMAWCHRGNFSGLGSDLYGADAYLGEEVGDALFEGLCGISIPPFSFPPVVGIDGTTFGVRRPEDYHRVELFWWCSPPAGWEPLADWHEKAVGEFESFLPSPSPETALGPSEKIR